jgi:uncharacterized spore protein YtfJ
MTDTNLETANLETMDLLDRVRDGIAARAVVGEPIRENGVVVVPVARVAGGAGGGGGTGPGGAEQGAGNGAGFGLTSRPVGAFVIRDGAVTWRPAVDVNRIVLGGQIVAIVALLTIRAIAKRRRR